MKTQIKLVLLPLAIFIAGCSEEFTAEFKKAYEESFRTSFRASFIGSCSGEEPTEETNALCTCIADDLLATFQVSDLEDVEKIKMHVQEVSVPKCTGNAQLTESQDQETSQPSSRESGEFD